MEESKQATNKQVSEDEVYAPESKLAGKPSKSSKPNQKKTKKNRIKRKVNSRIQLSPLELTMVVIGLLIAIGMIVLFYYMYDSAKHSNKAISQNGLITDDEDKSYLTRVVNANSGLPAEFEVTTSSVTGNPGVFVDSRITKDTVELLQDLKAHTDENVSIIAGYTSIQDYINQYSASVSELEDEGYSEAEAQAMTLAKMMQPGTDEHSTGLLINIGIDGSLDPELIKNSEAYRWLQQNAYKYGFILRYPEGKEDVTMHGYDPSAYRYVGRDLAAQLHTTGQTLEEYNAVQAEIAAQQAAAEQQAAEEQAATEVVDTATEDMVTE